MRLSEANRTYLAIKRDGKNPVEMDNFDRYFSVICSDGQITLPLVYPNTDEGLNKWNKEASRSNRLDFYLLKSKSGKLVSIKDVVYQTIDALLGASYDADTLTCISKFIVDKYPDIGDEGEKILNELFTNPKSLKDCFQLSEKHLKEAKGELEDHPEYFQNILGKVIENAKSIFENTKGIEVEVIPPENTEVVLTETDESESNSSSVEPFASVADAEKYIVNATDEDPKSTIDNSGISEEQKKVIQSVVEKQYTELLRKHMSVGNNVTDGERNMFYILNSVYNNPQTADVLGCKASAILDLLQKDKKLILSGGFSVAATDNPNDPKYLKLFNQSGDMIEYFENKEVRYTAFGSGSYVYNLV